MPAYLSRIAAAATGDGGNRVPILPTIRSRSPIAERDQRLTLTDTDWNFEDTLASESQALDTRIPRASALPPELDAAKRTPENFSENPSVERSQATSSVCKILPDQPPRRQRPPDQTPTMSPVVASLGDEDSMFEQPSIDVSPVTGKVPPQSTRPRAEATPPPRQSLTEPATKSGKSPMSPDQRMTHHPEHPQATTPTSSAPQTETAHPESDSIAVKVAPPIHEPVAPPRVVSEPRHLEQSPSPPSKTNRSRPSRRDPLTAEQRTEPARSGVVIDHLQVEVVPVPAEKPGPKPASSAPANSAPISQIGPLRGPARHLAFSVRYR